MTSANGNPHRGKAIELEKLTITAAKHVLLDKIDIRFGAGEITLIVGPSGVGKTLLLRAIADIGQEAGAEVSGNVRIGEQSVKPGRIGIVFQDFALFDELSPEGNIAFALSHRNRRRPSNGRSPVSAPPNDEKVSKEIEAHGSSDESESNRAPSEPHATANGEAHPQKPEPRSAVAWMKELDVPRGRKLRHLSGGQKQRVAIGRALAATPDALLYDEPTSGLDPHTADRVAELIRQTALHHGQTTVVVTHDYRSLVPIADRILIVDPLQKKLIEIPRHEWNQLDRTLESSCAETSSPPLPSSSLLARVCRPWLTRVGDFFSETTRAAVDVLLLLLALLPAWKSWRWGPYYLRHYLLLVAGPTAWLYLAIAGGIMGFVGTYFTFRFLPYASYTEPLLIDDLLGAVGFSLYRILVPILSTVLIAARCGAAVSSDIGGKRLGRQMEAMRSLQVPPRRYLLTGTLHAFLLGTPLLVAVSYLCACLASVIIFTWIHPELGADYWRLHFHQELWLANQPLFRGTYWLIAKVLICAIGIGLISYRRGAAPKSSTADVSRSVTSTILWATLYVLIVHFLFAFFEFKPVEAS